MTPGDLAAAREAYQRRDWVAARTGLLAADATAPLAADDRYALANCSWWLGDLEVALPAMQAAYRQFLGADRPGMAAMVALDVGYTLVLRGDLAQGTGWLARGRRLLQDQPDSAEYGYLVYIDFEEAFGGPDLARAGELASQVRERGRRHQDPTLVALGVLGQGRVALRHGNLDEGMAQLDEAMVAAVSDELDPSWSGNIYCHLMAACFEIADLRRAGEWTEVTARWCERMPGAGPFLGICRVHRAQVLRQWQEVGSLPEIVRVRGALAQGYEALADHDSAQRERAAARRAGEQLGISGTEDRPGRPARPGGLTEREAEVLALVAGGRTNQQIAADLVLSIRTVERHLATAYQKLGVSGRSARAAAVSFALREGLLAPRPRAT